MGKNGNLRRFCEPVLDMVDEPMRRGWNTDGEFVVHEKTKAL